MDVYRKRVGFPEIISEESQMGINLSVTDPLRSNKTVFKERAGNTAKTKQITPNPILPPNKKPNQTKTTAVDESRESLLTSEELGVQMRAAFSLPLSQPLESTGHSGLSCTHQEVQGCYTTWPCTTKAI